MLDTALKTQLAAYLEYLQHPIELVASLDDSVKSNEIRALLAEIAALSPRIVTRTDGHNARRPSFSVSRPDESARIHFAGSPMGQEFTSLVLALLHTGGHPPRVDADTIERIRSLEGPLRFETYIALSCHNCPDVVQALNLMAALNPCIESVMIDGALFQSEVDARKIMAVPSVMLNGEPFGQGRMNLSDILARLRPRSHNDDAKALNAKDPFDVLVVGGGPAGAAAALYAARKGLATGLVAERFGGQVQDTQGIENLLSVPHTEGPRLATAMAQHVMEYDVDVIDRQRVEALIPGQTLHQVRLANGAVLGAKSIILAPGARWRELKIPGEQTYKTRGVCFCPHCDGPLFRGKRVAVIGGGNSGVEAAIDLSNITSHVYLLEFDEALRADAVLQSRLGSLSNVTVITHAQPTEVIGDGDKVVGLAYRERASGEMRHIALDGLFVQIGLLPDTGWLQGSVTLSPRGEIEVDPHGRTSLPGVFAAGDATTAPYKQIITAMGDGAKASLAAFDYLIRRPIAAAEELTPTAEAAQLALNA